MKRFRDFFNFEEEMDRSQASIVTMVLLIPLFVGFMITMVDMAIYSSMATQMNTLARTGARTVAIFGGNAPDTEIMRLWRTGDVAGAAPTDGSGWSTICAGSGTAGVSGIRLINSTDWDGLGTIVPQFIGSWSGTEVGLAECGLVQSIGSVNLIASQVQAVRCGPQGAFMGQTVGCVIIWEYTSLPMSTFGFINGRGMAGGGSAGDTYAGSGTAGNVNINTSGLRPRPGSAFAARLATYDGSASTGGMLRWNLAVGTAFSEIATCDASTNRVTGTSRPCVRS